MKLSDIFGAPLKQTTKSRETEATVKESANNRINKQIKALMPGKTLQGEVVAKNGSEVKIKLSQDVVLTAKLDQDVNVEEGKVLTFEVKNNGSTVSLSPLFANTARADNVFKALQMAGLPINGTTVEMTEAMMQGGMSIDAKSLMNMFREVSLHPQSAPVNVVQLHQLGMPVNEANLQQMEQYKALAHQLVNGMQDVLNELPGAFSEVYANNGADAAIEMYTTIVERLLESGSGQDSMSGEALPGGTVGEAGTLHGGASNGTGVLSEAVMQGADALESMLQGAGTLAEGTGAVTLQEGTQQASPLNELLEQVQSAQNETVMQMVDGLAGDSQGILQENTMNGTGVNGTDTSVNGGVQNLADTSVAVVLSSQESEQLLQLVQNLSDKISTENTTPEMAALKGELEGLIKNIARGTATAEEVLQNLTKLELRRDVSFHEALSAIYKSAEFNKLLSAVALKQWSMKPEEVGQDGKVEEMYSKLLKQLEGLQEALQHAGAGKSVAAQNVTNLSQNIDFINQMNHLYTYVQLPLKMSGQNANGELYVYTNKRSLAKKDGNVSAFLHLDMEHLGPVDVYVAMQNNRVNTRFTLQDDEMLDFLNAHMRILDERLAKKGYNMNWEMAVKDGAKVEESPVDKVLHGEKGAMILSQYAFDMRA